MLGFDVLQPVTRAMLQDATAQGLRFVGRYLDNLDADEREDGSRWERPVLAAAAMQMNHTSKAKVPS